MLHYGYFVLLQNGRLVGAGNDWGPTPDTYKTGDSLGVKDGSEGTVAGVVKGAAAKRHGVDVMVIVDQQPATGVRNSLRATTSDRTTDNSDALEGKERSRGLHLEQSHLKAAD